MNDINSKVVTYSDLNKEISCIICHVPVSPPTGQYFRLKTLWLFYFGNEQTLSFKVIFGWFSLFENANIFYFYNFYLFILIPNSCETEKAYTYILNYLLFGKSLVNSQ
jgi:hypothetical protein